MRFKLYRNYPYDTRIRRFLYYSIYFYRFLRVNKRMLPQFLIIGAQKSGTTTLFRYLLTHSKILKPIMKEINYFDEFYHKGWNWYRMHFPFSKPGHLTGEASTSYLFSIHAPQRIKEHLPNVKFIVLLRNPIERAYSHYYHELRNGNETITDFNTAIEKESERIDKNYHRMTRDSSFYDPNVRRFAYIKKGIYADQFERWFVYFKPCRFKIIESNRLFKNPKDVVNEIADFLEISNEFNFEPKIYNLGKYKNNLDQNIYNKLREFYTPHNERLYRIIGERYDW